MDGSKAGRGTSPTITSFTPKSQHMSSYVFFYLLSKASHIHLILYSSSQKSTHTKKKTHTRCSLFPVCDSATCLPLHPLLWKPGCWKQRSVDNCLLLLCHQTALSHFTARLILRHSCQKMTFNFHTSSLYCSLFHEFYFQAHPQCIAVWWYRYL